MQQLAIILSSSQIQAHLLASSSMLPGWTSSFNPMVVGICRSRIVVVGTWKSSNPSLCYSSRPTYWGWLVACAYLDKNTSNPLLSRIIVARSCRYKMSDTFTLGPTSPKSREKELRGGLHYGPRSCPTAL